SPEGPASTPGLLACARGRSRPSVLAQRAIRRVGRPRPFEGEFARIPVDQVTIDHTMDRLVI
ncbi:MAG TPA: hypothetical protein VIY72_15790, partial [Acidimicrobiales bacterium]